MATLYWGQCGHGGESVWPPPSLLPDLFSSFQPSICTLFFPPPCIFLFISLRFLPCGLFISHRKPGLTSPTPVPSPSPPPPPPQTHLSVSFLPGQPGSAAEPSGHSQHRSPEGSGWAGRQAGRAGCGAGRLRESHDGEAGLAAPTRHLSNSICKIKRQNDHAWRPRKVDVNDLRLATSTGIINHSKMVCSRKKTLIAGKWPEVQESKTPTSKWL